VKKTIHQDTFIREFKENPSEDSSSCPSHTSSPGVISSEEFTIVALNSFISHHRQENPPRTIHQETHHSVSIHSSLVITRISIREIHQDNSPGTFIRDNPLGEFIIVPSSHILSLASYHA
jgi:hypothetical protein